MVYHNIDSINGSERYDVLLNAADAMNLSITENEGIVLYK
jgi:hypothetical protein